MEATTKTEIESTQRSLIETVRRATATPAVRNRAFGQIVTRFQDMAFGSAYAILGDYQLAEDVTQEAFLSAWQNLGDLRDAAAFPGWLRRIVRTQCHRLLRRKRVATIGFEETLVDLPDTVAADPETFVLRRERTRCIRAALAALPETERSVLVLFHIGDYTRAEIAEFLGLSPVAVKKRLASARARLKETMIEMLEEDLHEKRPSKDETFAARLTAFSKLFSALIDEGTSLVRALDRLSSDESDPGFRAVIEDINREIQAGNCLSVPMTKHAAYFDEMYISAIREGEAKGRLEVVLRDLARGRYVPNAILGQSEQFSDIARAVLAASGTYRPVAIEPEHYLLGLLTPPENDATAHLGRLGVDSAAFRTDVQKYLATLPRKKGSDWAAYSLALTAISDAADRIAVEEGAAEVTPLHFLTALAAAEGTEAARMLRERGVRANTV